MTLPTGKPEAAEVVTVEQAVPSAHIVWPAIEERAHDPVIQEWAHERVGILAREQVAIDWSQQPGLALMRWMRAHESELAQWTLMLYLLRMLLLWS